MKESRPGNSPDIPSARPEQVRKLKPQHARVIDRLPGFLSGNGRKIAIATALAVGSVPYLYSQYEDLDPVESAGFTAASIITAGSSDPIHPDDIRQLREYIDSDDPRLNGELSDLFFEFSNAASRLVLVGGIVAGATWTASSIKDRHKIRIDRIKEGREKLKPKGEQIFVLAGSGNYVVDELLKQGEQITPIYESSSVARDLLEQQGNQSPAYVNLDVKDVSGHSYLESPGWDTLELNSNNIINAKNGDKFLMVVGLGMKQGKELSSNPKHVAVSQDNLRSAALKIHGNLSPGVISKRGIVDVHVGNSHIRHNDIQASGEIFDRELALSTGVDIHVDSMDVAYKAITEELERQKIDRINLATTDESYEIKLGIGLSAFSDGQGRKIEVVTDPEEDTGTWLVYEGDNEATFNAARRIRKLKGENARIIALVTTDLSQQAQVGELENVTFINTSRIIAQIISDIKLHLSEGNLPDEIQKAIDTYELPIPRVQASGKMAA